MRIGITTFTTIALLMSTSNAQSVYRYRDGSGNWVYSDRKPTDNAVVEQVTVDRQASAPRIDVERVTQESRTFFHAINECVCTVEFGMRVYDSSNITVSNAGVGHVVLKPGSRQTLLQVDATGAGAPRYRYEWLYAIGTPGASHRPKESYRVPYAVGQAFRISQAYPNTVTHGTDSSRHAVDIAMPDHTPIHAARSGRVINVAHEHFRGGVSAAMADEANFVEILHDDETVAVYAHLHWDSIRVSPGQWIKRGEYIADSGNTGFSSGPHLHFAVTRNAGLNMESVPVTFAGAEGEAIVPQTGLVLRAY